jgi:Zn-dependent protease with chaperone function
LKKENRKKMQELFTYLLKSSGLIIAFFLAYQFLLHKETFFNSNRWFLLLGLVTSALLPLFFIKRIVFVERPKIATDDLVAISNNPISNLPEVATINWFQIIAFGYGIVVFILLIKVIINLFSLSKLLQNKQIEKQERFTFIDLEEDIAPFSFFNYIVFNSSLYSDNELENILLHEKIHSKEKHSFDILLAKLFTILFWFNPIVWLYKKAIVQNLEYIADNKAIQFIEDKKSYQKALLKVVSHQNCLPITNHFYQSLIKKRIVMLNKNQSNKRNSWKYAVVIPALIGFVFLFQVKVVAQDKFIELEDGSTISSKTREVTDMTWTKNSSDEEFKTDAAVMAKSGIIFNFSDIKRNSEDEITNIKISYKDKLNNQQTETYFASKGIKPIHFKRDIDLNGKGEIGLYSKNKDVLEIEKISSPEAAQEKNMLYIINGKEYFQNDMKGLTAKCDGSITHLEGKDAIEKFGSKGKDGVLIFNGTTTIEPKNLEQNQSKTQIITTENGDEVVFMNNKSSVKIPGNPTVSIDNSLILIVNGEVQKDAKTTIDNFDVTKIKTVKIVTEKDNVGTPIKKMIITTK